MDIVEQARRAVAQTRLIGECRRYSLGTKLLAVQAGLMMRKRGHSWAIVTDRLNLSAGSMFRWLKQFPQPAALVPVQIVPEVASPSAPSHAASITISLPNGIRAEGLTVTDLIAVLAAS